MTPTKSPSPIQSDSSPSGISPTIPIVVGVVGGVVVLIGIFLFIRYFRQLTGKYRSRNNKMNDLLEQWQEFPPKTDDFFGSNDVELDKVDYMAEFNL